MVLRHESRTFGCSRTMLKCVTISSKKGLPFLHGWGMGCDPFFGQSSTHKIAFGVVLDPKLISSLGIKSDPLISIIMFLNVESSCYVIDTLVFQS